jgi:hypothetical protein
MACKSACGFLHGSVWNQTWKGFLMGDMGSPHQSLSYSTTMSAETKLIPRPPARVVSRKTNFSLPGALYSSMAEIRSSCAVLPSMRQYSV